MTLASSTPISAPFDRSLSLYRLNRPGGGADRDALYQRLQQQAPVHWDGFSRCWVLTRYDEVARLLSDPGWGARPPLGPRPELDPDTAAAYHAVRSAMLFADGEEHTTRRAASHRSVGRPGLARVTPVVQTALAAVLDALPPDRPFDVVEALAVPLPLQVIGTLYGLPAAAAQTIRDGSDAYFGAVSANQAPTGPALQVIAEFQGCVRATVADHLAGSRGDLLDDLVGGGAFVDIEDLVAQVMLLVVGGHKTTSALITSVLYALLTHPEALARVRRYPELVATAVDETLRLWGPSQFLARTAAHPHQIGPITIGAGEVVVGVVAAANRDPRRFPDPHRFDLTRPDAGRHLGFGRGVRYCVGAHLARMEAILAVTAVLNRFPGLCRDTATEPCWIDEPGLRALQALLVHPDR